jgi:cell division protein FtsQ
LILAAAVVITSPIFDIRNVVVRGNGRLTAAGVTRLAGARTGENLVLLSTGRMERRLRGSPWLAEAEVRRSWPATLIILVRERRAVAEVGDASGGFVVVAADGILVERRGRPDPALASLGRVAGRPAVGSRLAAHAASVRVAASFDQRLARHVAEIHEDGGEVELVLARGGVVRYGEPRSLPQKNAAIRGMLRYARRAGLQIEYLDVRAPTSPVLKPAGAAPVEGVQG